MSNKPSEKGSQEPQGAPGAPILLHPLSQAEQEPLQSLEAEEEFIAALLGDSNAAIMCKDALEPRECYHEKPRAIVQAAWALLEQDQPSIVTRATIKDRLEAQGHWLSLITPHYLMHLYDAATEPVVQAALDNAAIIRKLYKARRIRESALHLAKRVTEEPDATDSITEKASKHMINLLATTSINKRDPSAAAILLEQEQDDIPASPTGLAWLDGLTGGNHPSFMTSILGRIKARKTTLARALMLKPLLDNECVSWFTRDGTRRETLNAFVAMFATTRLWDQNVPPEQWKIGALGLAKNYRTPEQHEAILWAQNELAQKQLRIYDSRDGIGDMDVLEAKLRRDILLYGCKYMVADFIQQFYVPDRRIKHGTEQYEAVTDRFASLTVSNPITSYILSQQNTDKSKGKPGEGGTTGAKGGEALPAKSDFVIETDYDSSATPGLMRVMLTRSRYSATGEIEYQINPASGLLLNYSAMA